MASREWYWGKLREAQRRAEFFERRITLDFGRLRKLRAQEKRYMAAVQVSDEDRAAMIMERRKRATARKAKRARRTRAFAAESE